MKYCYLTLCIIYSQVYGIVMMSNGPFYSQPTRQFIAQDGDTEQAGYQFFQGQEAYLIGTEQQKQQQKAQEMQIQNQMEAEYQQQIQEQKLNPKNSN